MRVIVKRDFDTDTIIISVSVTETEALQIGKAELERLVQRIEDVVTNSLTNKNQESTVATSIVKNTSPELDL